MSGPALDSLLEFLRRDRGFDFTGYKTASLERRIRHRMGAVGIGSLEDYHDFLEAHPGEFAALFDTVLVNVTSFFRDPEAWDCLGREIVPAILAAKGPTDQVRVWSAGCASGEEVYSLAMVFDEVMGTEQFGRRVKIYGTDLDDDAIATARRGEYTTRQLAGVSPERLSRYFEPSGASRRVFRADLRRSIVFGRHDLTRDTPISRVDLLACRNTLIYLNTETQAEVVARFHFALNPGGHLLLGRSEALVRYGDLFAPVDVRWRLFKRVRSGRVMPLRLPQAAQAGPGLERADGPVVVEQPEDLAEVAEALVDSEHRLAAANRACRALFGVGPDDIGRPVDQVGLFRSPVDLRGPVRAALAEARTFVAPDVALGTPPGEVRRFDVRVIPLGGDGEGGAGMVSVLFLDVTRTIGLERTAREARESLDAALAELQSANEELETMNEELQSASEQLDSMNTELRARTAKLDELNAFLESVLSSVHVGVVVLDPRLVVTSWNHAAEQLWGLWSSEVEGRSFFGLDVGLPLEQLRNPLLDCLDGRSEGAELVLAARNRRGREIDCRVAVTPLAGSDGVRTGVVVLMEESVPTPDGP